MRCRHLIVPALALLLALPAAAGTHYVTESRDGSGDVTGRREVWSDGTRVKVVETGPDDTRPVAERPYQLSPDGWRTVYQVEPVTGTYEVVRLDETFAEASAELESLPFFVRWGVSEPRVEILAREPGGDLLGLPTTRYEVHSEMELWFRLVLKKWNQRMETREEVWVTDAVRVPRAEGVLADFDTGSEKLNRLLSLGADKVPGFPLRQRRTTVTTGGDGEEEREVETTEVVALERGVELEAALFALPAGYAQVEDVDDR